MPKRLTLPGARVSVINVIFALMVIIRVDKGFQMKIYNRWGEPMYTTASSIAAWNGSNAEDGVYFYSIHLREREFKGWVT